MDFGFTNVILLHSDYRHVSATHVVIFRVENAIIQTYLECVWITPQYKSCSFGYELRGPDVQYTRM
jgi:hypothetical protein